MDTQFRNGFPRKGDIFIDKYRNILLIFTGAKSAYGLLTFEFIGIGGTVHSLGYTDTDYLNKVSI
jgi:hypothetical protein